jgi:hypothetical protein
MRWSEAIRLVKPWGSGATDDAMFIMRKLVELEHRLDRLEGQPQSTREITEVISTYLSAKGLIEHSGSGER